MKNQTSKPEITTIAVEIPVPALKFYRQQAKELGWPLHMWLAQTLMCGWYSETSFAHREPALAAVRRYRRTQRAISRKTATGVTLQLLQGGRQPEPPAAAAAESAIRMAA